MRSKATSLAVAVAVAVVGLAACYSVDFGPDGQFTCRNSDRCPEGFVCRAAVCVPEGTSADATVDGDAARPADGDLGGPRDGDIGIDDTRPPDQAVPNVCAVAAGPVQVASKLHVKGTYGVDFDRADGVMWVSFSRAAGSSDADASTLWTRRTRTNDPTSFEAEVKVGSQAAPYSAIDGYKGSYVVVYPSEKGELGAAQAGGGTPTRVVSLDSRKGVTWVAARDVPATNPQLVHVAFAIENEQELHALSVTRGSLALKDSATLVDRVVAGASNTVGRGLRMDSETLLNQPAVAISYFKANLLKANFDLVRAVRVTPTNWATKSLDATRPGAQLEAGLAMSGGPHLAHSTRPNAPLSYISPAAITTDVSLSGTVPRNNAHAVIAANKTQQLIAFVDASGALQVTARKPNGPWLGPVLVDNKGNKAETRVLDINGGDVAGGKLRYVILWREKGVSEDNLLAALLECTP
ncbi:MAG: hypothetical protein KC503_40510 [Myxococcales bacterium]|nr:hypothetical protein [Myxococcales bacterium]